MDGSLTETIDGGATQTIHAGATQSIDGGMTQTVSGGETRTVTGGQTETLTGDDADHQRLVDRVDQRVAHTDDHRRGEISTPAKHSVTASGGFELTTPASITLIANGGFKLFAPGGQTRLDEDFAAMGGQMFSQNESQINLYGIRVDLRGIYGNVGAFQMNSFILKSSAGGKESKAVGVTVDGHGIKASKFVLAATLSLAAPRRLKGGDGWIPLP